MRFLVDRCAGRRLAEWLRYAGHDVKEARDTPSDPGDAELLRQAHREARILVTLDNDFAALVFVGGADHAGVIRLPDVPAEERIALMAQLLDRHSEAEIIAAVVTIRGNRIRIAHPPHR
jgi:predicted nuclease of predicted toxin-antitoxin system